MEADRISVDFLTNKENYYLLGNDNVKFASIETLERKDIALYRIEEISFEDKAPRKEALENVLSAMRIEGINFIYLVLGNGKGVHFYYGVAKDASYKGEEDGLSVQDIGQYILEPSIKGNFRGSRIVKMKPEEQQGIIDCITGMQHYSILEGVPGYNKEDEKFQGTDRLADVMMGDLFGFMVVASPVNYAGITGIENNLYDLYTKIVPFSKKSIQDSISSNTGKAVSDTQGTSANTGKSYSKTKQESESITDGTSSSINKGTTKGTSKNSGDSYSTSGTSESGTEGSSSGDSHSEAHTTGGSETQGTNTSEGTSRSVSTQTSSGEGKSSSATIELVDRKVQEWVRYLDDIIIPRLDYGTGKGIFITSFFLFSDNRASLKKLENTAVSLYSGEKGNKVPLMAVQAGNSASDKKVKMLKNFQLPQGKFIKEISHDEAISRSALSQFVDAGGNFRIGNWITTNELAMIAGLPQKDVAGLGLKEEVEFGLNFDNNIKEENRIKLGKLVQSGNEIEQADVFLDKENLDKHMFITGVTGSGKTTTCHKILLDSGLPFLVIEPAKTEYRILTKQYDDLIVFTLGKDTVTPFRLNPFEFFPHESITSRVDMICAGIEASFDMEAAIPQIIETSIYECYKDYGWDIATNKNIIYGDSAFDDGVYAFPILGDLIHKVDAVVAGQGFDERLKNDYIGSIKARLSGLLAGAKGLMLNVRRSVGFKDLLSRRVILELEEIRSATEKSLVMGFILINLVEAIKAKYKEGKGEFKHITLVEEAHRLLTKYMPGDSPNKKHGVETFSDMLAEIRKYGEALVIVDQIPNKLTPEVLKNTNTKIVHRLFAEDDKEAIGNTIVLNHEQKEFLSNLETGRAIVFTQGFSKAVQVQVKSETNTTSKVQAEEERLQEIVYKYYAENYKQGVITGTQFFEEKPSVQDIAGFIGLSRDNRLDGIISRFCHNGYNGQDAALLREYLNIYSAEFLGKYMAAAYYLNAKHEADRKKAGSGESCKAVTEFINKYSENNITASETRKYKDEFMIRRN